MVRYPSPVARTNDGGKEGEREVSFDLSGEERELGWVEGSLAAMMMAKRPQRI